MNNKNIILADGERQINLYQGNISSGDKFDKNWIIYIYHAANNAEGVVLDLSFLGRSYPEGRPPLGKFVSLCEEDVDVKTEQLSELIQCLMKMRHPLQTVVARHYIDIILHLLPAYTSEGDCHVKSHKRQKYLALTEYIDKHIKKNITAQELMDISNMSERSLYYLFREVQGTTPLAFIRERKIEHLQRELRDQHSTRNITQIAMDYGFTNLGRFADLYRKQVGELPSESRLKSA